MSRNAITEQILIDTYLDYVNDYLTIKHMAGVYELSESTMGELLNKGKFLYEMKVLKLKRDEGKTNGGEGENSS